MIEAEKATYPIKRMCELLEVSRSGYYKWRRAREAGPSPTAARRGALDAKVAAFHKASDGVYGAPRILADLRAHGERVSRNGLDSETTRSSVSAVDVFGPFPSSIHGSFSKRARWLVEAGNAEMDRGLPYRVFVRWIVDGMNVIGSRPDGWWKDRGRAMVTMVERLDRWASTQDGDVTVVFERPPTTTIGSSVIEVAYAPKAAANSADDEIVRMIRADARPHEIRVVTSDRELTNRVASLGASTYPSASFRDLIDPRG